MVRNSQTHYLIMFKCNPTELFFFGGSFEKHIFYGFSMHLQCQKNIWKEFMGGCIMISTVPVAIINIFLC